MMHDLKHSLDGKILEQLFDRLHREQISCPGEKILGLLRELYEFLPEGNFKVRITATYHEMLRKIILVEDSTIALHFYCDLTDLESLECLARYTSGIMLRKMVEQSKPTQVSGVEFVRCLAQKLSTADAKTRPLLFTALRHHLLDFIECYEEHITGEVDELLHEYASNSVV